MQPTHHHAQRKPEVHSLPQIREHRIKHRKFYAYNDAHVLLQI